MSLSENRFDVMVGGVKFIDEDQVRIVVQKVMAEKEVSQRTLCTALGISRSHMYNWFYGKKSIKYDSLWKILVYLRDI